MSCASLFRGLVLGFGVGSCVIAAGCSDEVAREPGQGGSSATGSQTASTTSSTGGSATTTGQGGGAAGSGGFATGPYVHVEPEDVGTIVGPGVVGAAPTTPYDGPLTITEPTTIEDVVIDGCVSIESSDVVLRNVVITCDSLYPVRAEGYSNAVVEYSRIECLSSSKVFLVSGYQNLTVQFNDISGCEDFFFVGGDVDGLEVAYNYMHHLNLTADSHADGFQIGEASVTTGTIHIIGNWIGPEADGGKTDTLFATNECAADITLEDNFFRIWGLKTLRCGGTTTSCAVRHNVYEQGFEELEPFGPVGKLLFYTGTSSGTHTFECNRLEDGTFPPEVVDYVDRVDATDHVVDGCPPFPTR